MASCHQPLKKKITEAILTYCYFDYKYLYTVPFMLEREACSTIPQFDLSFTVPLMFRIRWWKLTEAALIDCNFYADQCTQSL